MVLILSVCVDACVSLFRFLIRYFECVFVLVTADRYSLFTLCHRHVTCSKMPEYDVRFGSVVMPECYWITLTIKWISPVILHGLCVLSISLEKEETEAGLSTAFLWTISYYH